MDRVRLIVHGRVQGVFFRANTQREAQRLGLSGWVRNLPDGSVEAVAEGERPILEELIAWCRRGPEHALVEEVELLWEEPQGERPGFRIAHG